MFVQVIEGKVTDRPKLEAQLRRWEQELRPNAIGFMGGTMGIAQDGHMVEVACFRSREDAMANSNLPAQSRWWDETATCFAGEPVFRETTDVSEWGAGVPDRAGFVQVMTGRGLNRDRLDQINSEMEQTTRDFRPDVLGGLGMWFGDRFFDVVYFSSEEEARKGEAQPMPESMSAVNTEMESLVEDMTFIDLRDPVLIS